MRNLLSCYLCMSCRLVFKVTLAMVFNAAVAACFLLSSTLQQRCCNHWLVLPLAFPVRYAATVLQQKQACIPPPFLNLKLLSFILFVVFTF